MPRKTQEQRDEIRRLFEAGFAHCNKCSLDLPVSDFNKSARNKNIGLQPKCKSCEKSFHSSRIKRVRAAEKPSITEKWCGSCESTLSVSEFGKNVTVSDGFQAFCKGCRGKYGRDADTVARKARWAKENPLPSVVDMNEKQYATYLASKEKCKAKSREESRARKYRRLVARDMTHIREQRIEDKAAAAQRRKELHKISYASWRENNPEKYKASVKVNKARRRKLEANASGSCNRKQLEARFDYHGNKCVYCDTTEELTLEHLIPLARGGTNWPANIAPSCASCNRKKWKSTHAEYLAKINE